MIQIKISEALVSLELFPLVFVLSKVAAAEVPRDKKGREKNRD